MGRGINILIGLFIGFLSFTQETDPIHQISENSREPQCSLSVRPAQIAPKMLDSIVVCTLWVYGVPNPGMTSWQISMVFDPSVLHYMQVIEGNFLSQGGNNSTLFVLPQGDPQINIRYPRREVSEDNQGVLFGCAILSGNTPPVGSGWLAAVRFKVRNLGTTKISADTMYSIMVQVPTSEWYEWGTQNRGKFSPILFSVYNP